MQQLSAQLFIAHTCNVRHVSPGLDEAGIDLLEKLLTYDPAHRLSAKKGLLHQYFEDLDKVS